MDILSEGEIPEEPEAKKLANLQQRALEYVEKLAKYEEVPRSADKEVVEAQLEAYCQSLLQWFQVVRPMMLPWTEPAVPDHASLNTDSKTDHQKPSEQQLFPPRLFEQALKFRETIQICKEVVKLRRTTFEQNKFLDKVKLGFHTYYVFPDFLCLQLQQWTGECEASDKEMESVSSISISSQITARTQKMLDQCQEEIKVSSDQTYAQVGQHLDATMHIVNQVHSLTGGNS